MGEEHLNPGPPHQVKLWEVARATSAAPLFFEKMVIDGDDYLDGGLGANNPAYRVAADIEQIHGGRFPRLILSIGTGKKLAVTGHHRDPDERISASQPRHFRHARGSVGLLAEMKNMVTDSEMTHRDLFTRVKDLRRDGSKYSYFRFNVPGIEDIDLDAWEPSTNGKQTLDKLRTKTMEYLGKDEIQKELRECAIELVDLRRKRASTERWEKYATDTIYSCPLSHDCTALGLPDRDELRRHLFECHEYATWATIEEKWYCTIGACVHTPSLLAGESSNVRKESFRRHLCLKHGFKNPTCVTLPELESQLNKGRTTCAAVLERRESQRIQEKINASQQRNSALEQRAGQVRQQGGTGDASSNMARHDIKDGKSRATTKSHFPSVWLKRTRRGSAKEADIPKAQPSGPGGQTA